MSSNPLAKKYTIDAWVVSRSVLKNGDRIVFYDYDRNMEVTAEVILTVEHKKPEEITIRRIGTYASEVLNIYNTITYLLNRSLKACSCGAKHTSCPTYHLSYCDSLT